jgi:hypothetical protein
MRLALVFVACLLFAPSLAAQTVIRPEPPLDSARASLRSALLVLRDSLNTIDGAAARLQRDYRQASAASLLSRARVMQAACAGSVRTVGPTKQAVREIKLSERQRVKRRAQLLGAMDELGAVLARCETEFASMSRPGEAETVRGYGNDRAVRVQAAIRKYEQAVAEFLGVMRIRMTPLGANPHELAG